MRTHVWQPAALVVAVLIICGLVSDAPVTNANNTNAFTPDGAAAELERLLAGERSIHGLPALARDPFLALVARDGPGPCPNGGPVAEGRAKDAAISGVVSHQLRLCPAYDIGSPLAAWGYLRSGQTAGEVLAYNAGYAYAPFPYELGCDIHQANCSGSTTTAPTTVAIAAYQLMTSAGHRDVVLSSAYDRFACGAWQVPWPEYASVATYYACLFASGPGTAALPSPSSAPTAAPTTNPTNTPNPTNSPEPSPSMSPDSSPTPIVIPTILPGPPPTLRALPVTRARGRERLAAVARSSIGVHSVLLIVDGHLRRRQYCHGASLCLSSTWLRLARGRHLIVWIVSDVDGRAIKVDRSLRVR
jgi:hypothetical protein